MALTGAVMPWEVEGGLEWDGWFSYDAPQRMVGPPQENLTTLFTRLRFSQITGREALAFSPAPGTVVRASQTIVLWLDPGKREFYLIERPPAASTSR
jgi:hypothetical protein